MYLLRSFSGCPTHLIPARQTWRQLLHGVIDELVVITHTVRDTDTWRAAADGTTNHMTSRS
jgi:hypothetical protein